MIEDIIDQYGSWEEYKDATGQYDAELNNLLRKVTEMKKDFEKMTFKEFALKYNIEKGGNYFNDVTAYVDGRVKGKQYFKDKAYMEKRNSR
jgi:hypothetical protein